MTNSIEALESFVEKQALSEGSIFAIATDKAKDMGYKDFSEGSKGREKRDEIAEAIKDEKDVSKEEDEKPSSLNKLKEFLDTGGPGSGKKKSALTPMKPKPSWRHVDWKKIYEESKKTE